MVTRIWDIPVPPSTNALYVVRDGRRRKTGDYKAWRKGAALVAAARGERMPVKTPLSVAIWACIDRRRDLDNLSKPLLDMLQVARVIADDRYVDRLELRRRWRHLGYVEIVISTMGQEAAGPPIVR